MPTEMNLDVETFSKADLKKVGLYKYFAHESTEILWIAFALDGGPVTRIDMSDPNYEHLDTFTRHLMDPWVIKRAFNAAFERAALAAHYGRPMDPRAWRCTMVQAAVNGLPMSLDAAAKVLGAQEKDAAGKALMKLFSMPQKPTKKNGQRTRIGPEDEPDKWIRYGDYCGTDVEAERQVSTRLAKMNPISDFEQALWTLDQEINDRGILVDLDLAANAIQMDEIHRGRNMIAAVQLTGLENPGSPPQLKAWLHERGLEMGQLTKETIKEALADDLEPEVREALELRRLLGKTSVSKYQAILASAGSDNRIRGAHQFYGARTGRWAGRILQTQNLPQNHIEALDVARETVLEGDLETLELLFDSVPDTLSQLIRTAIIAPPGLVLGSVDFSQIEARVISWLAGEAWRMEVFQGSGKIYEVSASRMFRVPLDQVDKKLRAKGKIAELALGYQGAAGSLISMGALTMGLEPRELQPLVDAWRRANPAIVQLWEDLEDSVIEAIQDGHSKLDRHLAFYYVKGTLYIRLPSGRRLAYASARVERFQGRMTVGFMAWIQGKWTRDRLYGGRIAENIVQAIARDLLAEKMLALDQAGFRIVSTIHDEILMEGGEGFLEGAMAIMKAPVAWAPGLPLTADGFESPYFKK